jgi:hypothetical protein
MAEASVARMAPYALVERRRSPLVDHTPKWVPGLDRLADEMQLVAPGAQVPTPGSQLLALAHEFLALSTQRRALGKQIIKLSMQHVVTR